MIFLLWVFLPDTTQAEQHILLKTIKNESNVLEIYNYINNIDWTTSNLNIIKALWKKDLKAYPDIPLEKLNNTTIRLALANILMQTGRHCLVKMDIDELHDFVKSRALSSNPRIKGKAIYILGLAGNNKDIPFLFSVVESEQEGFAEAASLSLVFINSKEALNKLQVLHKRVNRSSLKKFLHNLIMKHRYISYTKVKKCTN